MVRMVNEIKIDTAVNVLKKIIVILKKSKKAVVTDLNFNTVQEMRDIPFEFSSRQIPTGWVNISVNINFRFFNKEK